MSKVPTLPMGNAHPDTLTISEAIELTGKSRRTLMRAVKDMKIRALKDNNNHWHLHREDLFAWAPPIGGAHAESTDAHTEVVSSLRENLASETARADAAERARDQAESDRDRWRGMAEKLAEKPRRRWWWR
jgi:excisionase family DNA binding protein